MLGLLCLQCFFSFTDDIIPSESSSLSDTTTYDDGMLLILFFLWSVPIQRRSFDLMSFSLLRWWLLMTIYSRGKKSLIGNVFPHNGLVIEILCSLSWSELSLERVIGFNVTNLWAEGLEFKTNTSSLGPVRRRMSGWRSYELGGFARPFCPHSYCKT